LCGAGNRVVLLLLFFLFAREPPNGICLRFLLVVIFLLCERTIVFMLYFCQSGYFFKLPMEQNFELIW